MAQLEDDHTLSDYNIQRMLRCLALRLRRLALRLRSGVQIFVKTLTRKDMAGHGEQPTQLVYTKR